MANNFSVNNFSMYNTGWSSTTTTGFTDKLFYDWKTFIVNAGWTVIASGDGLSNYSLSTDIFTSAYKGIANGFANPKSWFVIQEPSPGYAGSRRQFLIIKPVSAGYINGAGDTGTDHARIIFYSQQGFLPQLHTDGSITSVVSNTVTFTATTLIGAQAGQTITLANATYSGNNGSFTILSVVGTTITFTNNNAVSGDTGITWNILSTTPVGHNNGAAISATNPPCAFDEICINDGWRTFYQGGAPLVTPSQTYNLDVTTLTTNTDNTYQGQQYWNTCTYSATTNAAVTSPPSAVNNYTSQFPMMYYSFFASTTAPYSWYIMTAAVDNNVGTRIQKFFMFDGILEYPAGHPDPTMVMYLNSSSGSGPGSFIINLINDPTWVSPAFTGAWENKTIFTSKADSLAKTYTNITHTFAITRLETTPTLNISFNAEYTGVDIVAPAMWYISGANKYHFGKAANMNILYKEVPQLYTATKTTSKDLIAITVGNTANRMCLCVPWNGSMVSY